MTAAAGVAPHVTEAPLAALLRARGIATVLFIDDAFDPLSAQEPTSDEKEEIWTAVQDDPEAFAAATAIDVSDEDGIDAALVARILAQGEEPLRTVLASSSYVLVHESKAAILRPVMTYLERLGVEVRARGRNDWQDHVEGAQIVFLDWRLGPDDKPSSTLAATKAARTIHERSKRPYLVLISSNATIKEESEAFSEASGLVRGMFDAMPKSWLADDVRIGLNLAVILDLYAAGDTVQGFVETLRKQAQEAVPLFLKRIERLTVSDYANLQHFALRKDGHPLGDYLTELFAGLWIDTLFQGDLRPRLAELDRQDFEGLPALVGPSDALADLHFHAAFDAHVGPLAPHPHAPAVESPRLQLSLGDVIVERETELAVRVHAVLNPQCDLSESPRGTRKIDNDRSILLVPGTLVAIDHSDRAKRKDEGDTPFIRVDGASKRVHWAGKELRTVRYADFGAWMTADRERIARMRPLQALALQRSVSAELTRVGLPNPPPIHDELDVGLHRLGLGAFSGDERITRQGRLVMSRESDEDRIVLTHAFLVDVATAMGASLSDAEDSKASWKKDDGAALASARTAMADLDEWRKLSRPFKLPKSGTLSLFGGALLVCARAKKPVTGMARKLLACVTLDLPATAPT